MIHKCDNCNLPISKVGKIRKYSFSLITRRYLRLCKKCYILFQNVHNKH